MKKIFITLVCIVSLAFQPVFAQQSWYDKQWEKYEKFISQELPESAGKVADSILLKAKAEQNTNQIINALLKISGNYNGENAPLKNIERLENELSTTAYPVKPILQSLLAEMYWRYYENNRWKINERSNTVGYLNSDVAAWSLQNFVDKVTELYMLSIAEPKKLKNTPVEDFSAIFNNYDFCEKKHFTLYDFLIYRCIQFYGNEEANITKPANQFTLNNAEYLLPAKEFTKLEINKTDTQSFKYQSIILYQQLIALHLNDSSPEQLLNFDIKRAEYVYSKMVHQNKDSLYLSYFNNLLKQDFGKKYKQFFTYRIIQKTIIMGDMYNKESPKYRWLLKQAYELCKNELATINVKEDSIGFNTFNALIEQINTQEVSITTENYIPVNEPFNILVHFKNTENLYIKIVPTTNKEYEKLFENKDSDLSKDAVNFYKQKTDRLEFSRHMPLSGDFQKHSTELDMPALSPGMYIIMVSTGKDFDYNKSYVSYNIVQVSDISYMNRINSNGTSSVYLRNRKDGSPLSGAIISVNLVKWDSKKNKIVSEKGATYTSDPNGLVTIIDKPLYNGYYIDIQYNNTFLSTREYNYNSIDAQFHPYYKTDVVNSYRLTNFFTDRAIYRPGQTIYFKGMIVDTDNQSKASLVKDYKTRIVLRDANYQEVATQEVQTNEYGTFSGTFTAPQSGLTGTMQLVESFGSIQFSVEEYKRPKFEANFNEAKGLFKLGDSITITGTAKAYSGAQIDNATVSYKVIRTARFPRYFDYYWFPQPVSSESQIAFGTTKTDAEGNFSVAFKAIPDPTVSKNSNPVFNYQIVADVTDSNGESRNTSTSLSIGYSALFLNATYPEYQDLDNAVQLKIEASNAMGNAVDAQIDYSVSRLTTPDKILRKRNWQMPDTSTLSKTDFVKLFPNDVYRDEDNFAKWSIAEKVTTGKMAVKAGKSSQIELHKIAKGLKPGKYLLELSSVDTFGNHTNTKQWFTVYSRRTEKLPFLCTNIIEAIKISGEPSEKAQFIIGTAYNNVPILYEIEKDNKIIASEWITINNALQTIEIPIIGAYRGNVGVHFSFIYNNRFYTKDFTLEVPRSDKQLNISFETFRNKLQPGEKEQWRMRIKGPKGEAVAAEMVASLYDASLDAFVKHSFNFSPYGTYYPDLNWQSANSFDYSIFRNIYRPDNSKYPHYGIYPFAGDCFANFYETIEYDYMNEEVVVVGYGTASNVRIRGMASAAPSVEMKKDSRKKNGHDKIAKFAAHVVVDTVNEEIVLATIDEIEKNEEQNLNTVQARTNLNETAFFYPHLQTDDNGDILINFTIPEALTRWKMLGFAHTKDLKFGFTENELITQKTLMVTPNAPRFFRENDTLVLTAKINNLSDKSLQGKSQLFLFDALTMKPIDSELLNTNNIKAFEVDKSAIVSWTIAIPEGIQAITYKIVASAGNFSDGEEATLPVLTNRMLVTETMPLPVKGAGTKTFTLSKMANNTSKTLKHHKLTLEFTNNPAWYAIQALPYLMEYPYECAEQTFSRYYANSIASHIANSNPRIKQVFDSWKNITPDALLSNLEKNQELKALLLEETPWVLNAQSENERKQRVALLFDLNHMSNELNTAFEKLNKLQASNGGFPWFAGMKEDRYITQHILCGFGKLQHIGILSITNDSKISEMTESALRYTDARIVEDFASIQKRAKEGYIKLSDNNLSSTAIHYLYTRSFYTNNKPDNKTQEAIDYYKEQCQKYWQTNSIYMQGMIAIALHRAGNLQTPISIIKSLREKAIYNDEMGMYWNAERGWYWYQAPIETQSLLIEAFEEIENESVSVNEMQVWLLKQKQTQDWKTTKATVEACYALLLHGTDMLANNEMASIKVGEKVVDPAQIPDIKVEAGTGYFKTSWNTSEIKPEMATVTISKKSEGVSWGALYWQYFEQLDKITSAETPLKINKQLFVEHNTKLGKVIELISDTTHLKPGDLIKVRMEIRCDRDMEYVHLKDMRASGLEPINVLSGYRYKQGLGYYESTRDAATNFFISYLPKGTYVFEYPLKVTHYGNFSNGITSIQCMYAPEFSSHSEGIRVTVK